MVAQIVLLELEWVMRGYYDFSTEQVAAVLRHLLSLPQVTIESYHDCEHVASFDDRKFARRAKRLQLLPHVAVPT
ncbi:hypothetical protein [Thiobaca trueperi]|uniref:Uncharacterized protein n=1 Tax=Thiobaca trueperi TaxID=127458 RepID=A0A4R3MT20_9GAMM|nr:hypothetical protein [Thiobaca trueperi]TCT18231.1 hypothetical protein EDC35_11351 [Thiobaca trueperi]